MIRKLIFDQFCELFRPPVKDSDLWMPLVRRLMGHELNVLGQRHLVSDFEFSLICDQAKREASYLVLVPTFPKAQMMPKMVALENGVREVFFKVFNDKENQNIVAMPFRTNRRDDISLYNSLVFIVWQYRIWERYHSKYVELVRENPIAKDTIGVAFYECLTTSQQADAYKDLKQLLMDKANFRIPVDEKESLVNVLLGEQIAKLREMPFSKVCYEVFYTDTIIWRRIAKKLKTASEKQWQSMVNLDDIQTPVASAPKPIPKLDDNQRKPLKRAYGKSADKVIEVSMNDPDATIPEIAKRAGVSEKTVKRIRAEIRKKGREKFSNLL